MTRQEIFEWYEARLNTIADKHMDDLRNAHALHMARIEVAEVEYERLIKELKNAE